MSKKKFNNRQHKEPEKVVADVSKTADALAVKDDNGIAVITMNRRRNVDTSTEKDVHVEKHEITNAMTLHTINDYTLKAKDTYGNRINDIESKVNSQGDNIKTVIEEVNNLADTVTQNHDELSEHKVSFENAVSYFNTYIENHNNRHEADSQEMDNRIGIVSNSIVSAVEEAHGKYQEIDDDMASIKQDITSALEGFDNYKGIHELEHADMKKHFASIDGQMGHIKSCQDSVREIEDTVYKSGIKDIRCFDMIIRTITLLAIACIAVFPAVLIVLLSRDASGAVVKIILNIISISIFTFIIFEVDHALKLIKKCKEEIKNLNKD